MLVALAACSDASNATAPVAAPSIGVDLRPGLYRTKQIGDVEIDGDRCITADQVAKGVFVPAGQLQSNWTVQRNIMSNGKIEFEAQLPSNGRMIQTGTYRADSFMVEGKLSFTQGGQVHRVVTVQKGEFVSPTCSPDAVDDEEGEAEE